jgi:hypothetical protein
MAEKISEILLGLSQRFTSENVSIRELRDAMSDRVYGVLLLILALPNLIPFPVPGISAITGLPLLLLTLQLAFNKKNPWFPRSVLERAINTAQLQKICRIASTYLQKLERFILPRFFWLVSYPTDRVIALVCVLLSLMIMLPLPFSNALPALAICLFSIARLQQDGLFVLLGMLCSIFSAAITAGLLSAMFVAILHFLGIK